MRTVKVGEKVGAMWVIDDGLKLGEQVVVEGQQKLREGTLVDPKLASVSAEGN
jgi:membrane fusion protein (multidrug efflux system)